MPSDCATDESATTRHTRKGSRGLEQGLAEGLISSPAVMLAIALALVFAVTDGGALTVPLFALLKSSSSCRRVLALAITTWAVTMRERHGLGGMPGLSIRAYSSAKAMQRD